MLRKPPPPPERRRAVTIGDGTAGDRVAAWRSLMNVSGTIAIDPELASRFTADWRSLALGSMLAVRVAADTYRFRRDRSVADRIVRDQMFVNFVERGRFAGRMAGRRTVVEAGGVLVTRHGVTMDIVLENATWYGLLVPLSRVTPLLDWRPALDATVFAPGSASAVLLGPHLRSLMDLPDDLSAARAGRIATESLRFVLPHLGGAMAGDGGKGAEGNVRAATDDDLRHAVRRFIADHLADPELGPAAICATFALSRSRLYRLFEAEGRNDAGPDPASNAVPGRSEGMAGSIRRLRLLCAHRDFADPSAEPSSIGAVGARWGMPDERSFRRAFAAQFGYPPSHVRKRMRRAREPSAGGPVEVDAPLPPLADATSSIERWFAG